MWMDLAVLIDVDDRCLVAFGLLVLPQIDLPVFK